MMATLGQNNNTQRAHAEREKQQRTDSPRKRLQHANNASAQTVLQGDCGWIHRSLAQKTPADAHSLLSVGLFVVLCADDDDT